VRDSRRAGNAGTAIGFGIFAVLENLDADAGAPAELARGAAAAGFGESKQKEVRYLDEPQYLCDGLPRL
jgi:hypothetical protein